MGWSPLPVLLPLVLLLVRPPLSAIPLAMRPISFAANILSPLSACNAPASAVPSTSIILRCRKT
jgi:hypothetical protein